MSKAIPTYRVNSQQVDDAFKAFAALQDAAKRDPVLLGNDYFKALHDTAYARFLAVFEAL